MKFIRGRVHQCFLNAIKQVGWHPDWKYVEGFLVLHIVPIHHAWALDENGSIVECTITKKSKIADTHKYHPCVTLTAEEAWKRKCELGYHAIMTREESFIFYREYYKDSPATVEFYTGDGVVVQS
ncbi:MAG TPA: hypothetical protein VN875_09155 [Candidatus Binatus sp.]|nr:hypothetical protein [Candidatus Binatus sp.]